jgi:2-isopropylmalate synthase
MRREVFGLSEDEVIEQLALRHVRLIRTLVNKAPETEWVFQYSPEMFSTTELEFSRRIVDAVVDTWGATPQAPCIINLPSTVEASTPNTFADMIEWMHRNVAKRDAMILSVHPQNDRGTGTAAAELALMAGADRLEGCLFGNGERTGNLDLVNVALNLYSQGVHPRLDVSDIDLIRDTVEHCNQLPVHPRHPYVGDLVYTSFSGSHQDAIKKVLGKRRDDEIWDVPYLPIDPADLGRSYQAMIRVNSQSGKGGITYLLEHEYGIALPRRAQIEFSGLVQHVMDDTGKELTASDIWDVFHAEYLVPRTTIELLAQTTREAADANGPTVECEFNVAGEAISSHGQGADFIAALVAATSTTTGVSFALVSSQTQPLAGAHAHNYGCYVELRLDDGTAGFGIGIASNEEQAQTAAVLSACNRLYRPDRASAAA